MGTAELPRAIDTSRRLTAYFVDRGLSVEPAPGLESRTDAAAFTAGGIAAVGLTSFNDETKTEAQAATFGGTAGLLQDACYHLACDRVDNVDVALLREMTAAYATAILDIAFSDEPPAGEGRPAAAAVGPTDAGICRRSRRWTAEPESLGGGCGRRRGGGRNGPRFAPSESLLNEPALPGPFRRHARGGHSTYESGGD